MEKINKLIDETIQRFKARNDSYWFSHTIKLLEKLKKMNIENEKKIKPRE